MKRCVKILDKRAISWLRDVEGVVVEDDIYEIPFSVDNLKLIYALSDKGWIIEVRRKNEQ